jgi:murein DD-endopeptidase MepM/ murein hydrolase activator NlpD
VLRLFALLGAALVAGVLLFTWLGRSAPLPTEVQVLSAYRSYAGANQHARLQRHAGVDFGGPLGSPVIAAAEGTVANLIDWPPGCGLGIVLSHSEFRRFTVYCHLQKLLVRAGQEVARGEIIGRMGTTGNAVGVSHVHFELCTSACTSHADGDLWGTADPLKLSAGCFDPARPYPVGRLTLTYPVPCGGVYLQR